MTTPTTPPPTPILVPKLCSFQHTVSSNQTYLVFLNSELCKACLAKNWMVVHTLVIQLLTMGNAVYKNVLRITNEKGLTPLACLLTDFDGTENSYMILQLIAPDSPVTQKVKQLLSMSIIDPQVLEWLNLAKSS